jgi:hypothetical protein
VVILPILAQAATTIARARAAGQLWELRRRIPIPSRPRIRERSYRRLERFGFILLSTQHGYRRRHGAALDV